MEFPCEWSYEFPRKTMKSMSVSMLLLGLWTPALVAAEPETPRDGGKPQPNGPRAPWHKQLAEGWKNADTDNDGTISRAEFDGMGRVKSLPEDKRDALFKRLDKDGNGSLSREEVARLFRPQENLGPKVPRLTELDKDGSGGVSLDEFRAGEVFKKLNPERQEALFRRLDVDGDGAITPKDRPPIGRQGGPGGPGGQPHDIRGFFRSLDRDGDGFLTFEEFRQAPMFRGLDEDAQEDRFEQLDGNKDLKLDGPEFSRFEPKGEGRGQGKPQGPQPQRRGEGPQPPVPPQAPPAPAGPPPVPPQAPQSPAGPPPGAL